MTVKQNEKQSNILIKINAKNEIKNKKNLETKISCRPHSLRDCKNTPKNIVFIIKNQIIDQIKIKTKWKNTYLHK